MSLINQVLKDIDKREKDQQPPGRSTSRYESAKRPLPAWVFMLLGILGTVFVLFLILALWRGFSVSNVVENTTEEHVVHDTLEPVEPTLENEAPIEPTVNKPVAAVIPQAVIEPPRIVATEPTPEIKKEPEAQALAAQPGQMTMQPSRTSPRQLAERRFQQAMADLQAGRTQQGAQRLQEALLIAPDYHEVRQQLAVYYFSYGFLTDALAVLEQGLDEFPGEPSLILIQARILERAGEQAMALQALSGVTNDLPLNADLLVLRGALASELGDYMTASATYASLTSWRPREGRWWLGLAIAKEELELYEEALQAYRRALDDPSIAVSTREFIHQRVEELR